LTSSPSPKVENNQHKVSLWLLPEPIARKLFREQIFSVAEQFQLPAFTAHVTLVGGHNVACDEDSVILLDKMRVAFHEFGPVSCIFKNPYEILTMYRGDEVQWNQSCIQILERTPSLLNAVKLTNQVMETSSDQWFKPVSLEPHFSWAYSDREVDSDLLSSFLPPPNFSCETDVLMKTSPSSLKGVLQWEPLGSPIAFS